MLPLLFISYLPQQYGYFQTYFQAVGELREDLDDSLFHRSRHNSYHVLHQLLLQPTNTHHNLRQRAHNLTLPTDVNVITKQNFATRVLLLNIYCFQCIVLLCVLFTLQLRMYG